MCIFYSIEMTWSKRKVFRKKEIRCALLLKLGTVVSMDYRC